MATIWRNLEFNKKMLRDAARSRAFIIFDTETTGIKKDDEIIELAARKCCYHGGEFKAYDELHIYIRPDKPVPDNVSEINHISNEFLKDKPDPRESFPKVREFFGDQPVVGAYNSPFDVRMMNGLYAKNGEMFQPALEVDLLRVAKDIFCEQKLKDHKLATVANTYGVDEGIQFHTAADDVKVLVRVLNAMVHDIEENGASGSLKGIRVFKLNYYPMFRGNARLYASTSIGPIYYDYTADAWLRNDGKPAPSGYDMAGMEAQVFNMTGCPGYKEIRKMCTSMGGQPSFSQKEA